MKIPFKFLPAAWGLKGRSRAIAEAEYYFTGMELEMKLAELEEEDLDRRAIRILRIQKHYNNITPLDFDLQSSEITLKNKPDDLAIEQLEIQFRHHQLERPEYEKKMADLKEEPWVSMPNIQWNPNDPKQSFFELDYNDFFVSFLRENNYVGATDEIIVEQWLNDICRSVVMDMGQDDPAFLSSPAPTVSRRLKKGKKIKTEYS